MHILNIKIVKSKKKRKKRNKGNNDDEKKQEVGASVESFSYWLFVLFLISFDHNCRNFIFLIQFYYSYLHDSPI